MRVGKGRMIRYNFILLFRIICMKMVRNYNPYANFGSESLAQRNTHNEMSSLIHILEVWRNGRI